MSRGAAFKWAMLLLLAIAGGRGAGAREFTYGDTVETLDWMIADSDLVVRGRAIMVVIRVDPVTRADDWEEATIRVYETIKGKPVGGDLKILRSTRHHPVAPWGEGPCLFLLVHGRRAAWLDRPDFLEGRFLLVDPASRMIPLGPSRHEPPPRHPTEPELRRPDKLLLGVYTAGPKYLTDPEEILAAARDTAVRQATVAQTLRPAVMGPPGNKGAHSWTGIQFLTVPADEHWLNYARARLAFGDWTSFQVEMGDRYFHNEMTERFAFEVLSSPAGRIVLSEPDHWPTDLEQFEIRDHFNRADAAAVLKRWGVPAAAPGLTSPLLPRGPIRPPYAMMLGGLTLLLGPWLLGRRRAGGRRLVAWACLLLAGGAAFMGQRSRDTYDSVIWEAGGAQQEWSSCYGNLRCLILSSGPHAVAPEPRRPAHGAVSLADVAVVPHHTNYLTADNLVSRWGLSFGEGLTPPAPGFSGPSTPANAWRFRLVTIPYAWLFGALLVYPAWRGVTAVARGWRAGRRARSRRCAACGYDVRHAPRRCPECGTRVELVFEVPRGGAAEIPAR